MKIIMTGATGYIGSAVADALLRANHDVTGVAHTAEGRARLVDRDIHAIAGDIAAPAQLADRIAGAAPDAVVWAATANRADVDAPAVQAILERLAGSGAAFVYTSGAWVHGETGDAVVDETTPLNPIELVEWRVEVERRVLETAGVRGIVIRPGIVYGHGGGIPAMLTASARNEGAARFVGTGHNRWPLVFIEDLADLYRRAVERAPAATVLLGVVPSSFSVLDVARAASEGSGAGGRTSSWPLEAARKELGAFADALAIDQARLTGRRAEETLGWTPRGPSIVDELRTGSYALVTQARTAS
jgi:nucleoside-diphosphate-sugar epimerase